MPGIIERYTKWLHTQWPAGTVEKLPDSGEDGATALPGVRIVGDLTGIPLLKFSSDTGARAVRAILRGEQVEVDGAVVQMLHGDELAPKRPIATPIVVAANGPKGIAVARELGDGVMTIGGGEPSFDWCSALH